MCVEFPDLCDPDYQPPELMEPQREMEPPKEKKEDLLSQFQRILAAEDKKRSEAEESTKPKPPKAARVDDGDDAAQTESTHIVKTESQDKAVGHSNELNEGIGSSLTKSNDTIPVPHAPDDHSSSLHAAADDSTDDAKMDDEDKPSASDSDAMKDEQPSADAK